jgi:hypothetical protein
MPVDERTFLAVVAGWVNEILGRRPDLPFRDARVEEHSAGGSKRHDLKIYRRGTDGIILTGEAKMPDSPEGKRGVYDAQLIEDAFEKASRSGSKYYFTWNVRDFALFKTHAEGVPFMDRVVEDKPAIVLAKTSDETNDPAVVARLRVFWEEELERIRDLDLGAPVISLPLDQRFLRRIEGTLTEPIDLIHAAALQLRTGDASFSATMDSWMRDEQGWEVSVDPMILEANVGRAARLSSYSLLNRIVFYEVVRRQFGTLPPLASLNSPDAASLQKALTIQFSSAIAAAGDYQTIFNVAGFGATMPFITDDAVGPWLRVVRNVEEFDFSRLDYDVIGRMYEQLIGPEERSRYGQFYTAPEVVDLVNAFCIRDPGSTVLDPACGGDIPRACICTKAGAGLRTRRAAHPCRDHRGHLRDGHRCFPITALHNQSRGASDNAGTQLSSNRSTRLLR